MFLQPSCPATIKCRTPTDVLRLSIPCDQNDKRFNCGRVYGQSPSLSFLCSAVVKPTSSLNDSCMNAFCVGSRPLQCHRCSSPSLWMSKLGSCVYPYKGGYCIDMSKVIAVYRKCLALPKQAMYCLEHALCVFLSDMSQKIGWEDYILMIYFASKGFPGARR